MSEHTCDLPKVCEPTRLRFTSSDSENEDIPEQSKGKTNGKYENENKAVVDMDESKHVTNYECPEKDIEINSQKKCKMSTECQQKLKEVQDLGTNEQEESKPIERVLQLNKAAPSRRQIRDRLEELGIYDTRPVVDSISYRLVHNDSVHINDK